MLAKLNTFALVGIEGVLVEAEVDNTYTENPRTNIVGLPDMAVRESIFRIERAMSNLDYARPSGCTTINLAPGDLRKDATAFDLPIALGMLIMTRQLKADGIADWAMVGELALDGSLRHVKGALSMAMAAVQHKIKKLMVPMINAREAAVVSGVDTYGVATLDEAVGILSGQIPAEPITVPQEDLTAKMNTYDVDFSDVRGQEYAKRALVVAASGGHNILLIGSPGSGKTMLTQRLATILPSLSPAESLETTRIYSATGRLPQGVSLLATRPFRSPHHTISDAGMVGGGHIPTPGEISMAHHGVLFLDELPEFNRRSLEVLRQPLEEGRVTISRAMTSTTFPARFILVAAMNPCPCGYLGDAKRPCKCTGTQIEKYLGKISGPLLDRIDMHIEVPAVPFQELAAKHDGTSSKTMRDQVMHARGIQSERFSKSPHKLNSRMTSKQLREYATLDSDGMALLKLAMESLGLSARAHDRILRVSRTIADLEGCPTIQEQHVSEAIGYRTLDRKLWVK